jgi:hypothetical protein
LTIGGVSAGAAALLIPAGDILSDVSSGAFAVGNYGDSSSELRLSTRGFTAFRTGATDGTNGSEQMRLTSTGLGIGTSSPAARLGVAGNAIFSGAIPYISLAYDQSGGTPNYWELSAGGVATLYNIGTGTNGQWRFVGGAGTEHMRLDSSGNLGIGTSSPATKLNVKGTDPIIRMATPDNSMDIGYITSGGPSAQRIRIGSAGGATDVGLTVLNSGNVGIGTSSPLSPLDVVVGAGGARRILLNYDDSLITIKGASNTANPETLRLVADNIRFNTGITGSGTEHMRLDTSGNLGLGVTPSAWFSTIRALQIGSVGGASIAGNTSAGGSATIGLNVYFDAAAATARYGASSFASRYSQLNGAHEWFTSTDPTPTAGNAISFSQVMTVSSDGTFRVKGAGVAGSTDAFQVSGSAPADAARIDSSGRLLVGTSSAITTLTVRPPEDGGIALQRPGSTGTHLLISTTAGGVSPNYTTTYNTLNNDMRFSTAENSGTGGTISFLTGTSGTATERARITSTGNVVAGGSVALATTATDGFLYVPTCAGTPTGTPTAITGMAPIVVNTTNNKLYFYSGGAWRDAGP